ncbi:conserved hypothetical protein [Ricinus communis]|uniref:Uncharacterized protein n=1 Tax=Ricinus communis TaxID=3988 RepID=B9RQ03_RICCO|nr:conserved hypothetical protein [Ricinus communis]
MDLNLIDEEFDANSKSDKNEMSKKVEKPKASNKTYDRDEMSVKEKKERLLNLNTAFLLEFDLYGKKCLRKPRKLTLKYH